MIAMTTSSSSSVNAGLPIRICACRRCCEDKVGVLSGTPLTRGAVALHPANMAKMGIRCRVLINQVPESG